MTKNQLIEKVAKKAHLTKRAAAEAVDSMLEIVKDNLLRGEKTVLSGFGTFLVRKRAARRGRNPQTGVAIQIPGKKLPSFVAGKTIKRLVR